MAEEVAAAINSIGGAPEEERGIRALALEYALAIDKGRDLGRVGPGLLAALEALNLTPRAARPKAGTPDARTNPLDRIRDELADRRDRGPTVDTTAS